jgi:hypothetical protein
MADLAESGSSLRPNSEVDEPAESEDSVSLLFWLQLLKEEAFRFTE